MERNMEWLLIPCVALGFAIGWFTTRKRPMRLCRQKCIENLFGTAVDEMINAYAEGEIHRPLEMIRVRRFGPDHSIQFKMIAVIVPDDFTAGHEPLLIIEKNSGG